MYDEKKDRAPGPTEGEFEGTVFEVSYIADYGFQDVTTSSGSWRNLLKHEI